MHRLFERVCPVCGNLITYRENWLRSRAERQKSKCRSCHSKSIIISDEGKEKISKTWFKKGGRPLNADFRKGKNLKEIYKDKAESIRVKYSNRIVSQESNIKRSISCKEAGCGFSNKGRRCTDENRKLYRVQMIERLQKTHRNFHPGYNTKACTLFDNIMEFMGIKIQHALNGGEYHIKELGYFVDGYDKENNVVFEYDERAHYDVYGHLNERDIRKQIEIENFLNCRFIRIRWDAVTNKEFYNTISDLYKYSDQIPIKS